MWHVKDEIAPAILLVVDFGGWYKIDSQFTNNHTSPPRIEHGQVTLTKDVIVPYTHLLPTLHISDDKNTRSTLLYFKGTKHRHRGGLVREKLWEILQNEHGLIMEEGFPNSTGKAQSIKGMRSSQFCLSPAGDTPTSCRLFDSIASLCVPVIISDNIVLPFEGPLNYSDFALSISEGEALEPGWLVEYLRGVSGREIERLRGNLAKVQRVFEFGDGENGAVEHIWKMVQRKVLMVEETVSRETRRPKGVEVPLRGHYTR
ncbi:hypothetical protein LUZ60_002220 [Juncus effusus]|nr:hypothetical protein LUZ60_002220 [Juncus effusus]